MKKKTLIIITAALVVVVLLAFFGDDLVDLIKNGPAVKIPDLTTDLSEDGATDVLKGLTIDALEEAWGVPSDELLEDKGYVWAIPNDNEFLVIYYDDKDVITEVRYVFVMKATVTEITGNSMLVRPFEGEPELASSDTFTVSLDAASEMVKEQLSVGAVVYVSYSGAIMETYPAQFSTIMRIDVIQSAG